MGRQNLMYTQIIQKLDGASGLHIQTGEVKATQYSFHPVDPGHLPGMLNHIADP
jgi:hypothetical protein